MIDQKIRATVLESRTISGQICSFIEGQRRPVSPEEIGAAFPDIFPRWRLRQRLSEMVQQGRIGITDNGSYIFIRPAKGGRADIAWRAARLLREFTMGDLAKTTGLSLSYCKGWIRAYLKNGSIRKIVERKGSRVAVYQMATTEKVRPPFSGV